MILLLIVYRPDFATRLAGFVFNAKPSPMTAAKSAKQMLPFVMIAAITAANASSMEWPRMAKSVIPAKTVNVTISEKKIIVSALNAGPMEIFACRTGIRPAAKAVINARSEKAVKMKARPIKTFARAVQKMKRADTSAAPRTASVVLNANLNPKRKRAKTKGC